MTTVPLRALQAFEAVGRCGSVSAAATELGVTPGAISQQIRKAEECLGVSLVERHGRRVELTRWGRLYYQDIAQGFRQFALAGQRLERARADSSLVVSALSSVINKWLGRHIFDWQAIHPEAHVRLIGTDLEPRFGTDNVDFRLTYGSRASRHAQYAELFRDRVVPACAPALLEGAVLQSPADIFRFPLLHIEWDREFLPFPRWSDLARRLSLAPVEIDPLVSFALSSTAIDAAVNRRGFVLAQHSMIGDELAVGTLVVPFDIRLPLPESYFLAWDRAALQKPFGPAFRGWVQGLARARQASGEPGNSLAELK